MQRKAVRATVSGADTDIPLGVFVSGGVLSFDGTQIKTVSAPAVIGDVVGPASAVSGNLPSFNGTTGKLLQDSGVAAALINAHAARHNPGGADPMFPGTWAAEDRAVWSGSAWVPRRTLFNALTSDQTGIGTGLTNVTGFPTPSLPNGTYILEMNGWYWSSIASAGFGMSLSFSGSQNSITSIYVETTTAPGLAVDTTSLGARIGTSSLAPVSLPSRLPFRFCSRIVVTAPGVLTVQASANVSGTTNISRGTYSRIDQVA